MDLSWLATGDETGHMHQSEKTLNVWRDVQSITGFTHVMEIGFNAGHSSSMVLELFPTVKVHSYDICLHTISEKNAKLVKDKYGDRFEFFKGDSKKLNPIELLGNCYDIVFIDGDHTYDGIRSDYELAKNLGVRYVFIDDYTDMYSGFGIKKYLKDIDANIVKHYDIDSMNSNKRVHPNNAVLVEI